MTKQEVLNVLFEMYNSNEIDEPNYNNFVGVLERKNEEEVQEAFKYENITTSEQLKKHMDELYINDILKKIKMEKTSPDEDTKININNSYEYMKIFCEQVPYKDINEIISMDKTTIPIESTKKISRDIINVITPEAVQFFDKYINEYVKISKGDALYSNLKEIFYSENIGDIYTTVHEFYHYYMLDSDISPKFRLCDTLDIYDEAKSIMSEKLVEHILKNNIVDLKDYNLNISNEEKELYSKFRLYSERYNAGNFIWLYNIKKVYDECVDNNEILTLKKIKKHFNKFDKESIENKIYNENINNTLSVTGLSNRNIFSNNFYVTHIHPISYIVALDKLNDMDLNNNDYKVFNEIIKTIIDNGERNIYDPNLIMDLKDKFSSGIIQDLKINPNKTAYVKTVLTQEYNKQNNKFNKQISKQPSILPKRKEEKKEHKKETAKMKLSEKKMYEVIKKKKELMSLKQKQNDNIKTLSNNGFLDVILGSIITIIIGLIIFMLIK